MNRRLKEFLSGFGFPHFGEVPCLPQIHTIPRPFLFWRNPWRAWGKPVCLPGRAVGGLVKGNCQYPEAAVTNDHKLGGLKQQQLLSQFWRPEAETTVSAGAHPSGGSGGDSTLDLAASGSSLHPLTCIVPLQSLPPRSHRLLLAGFSILSWEGYLSLDLGLTQIIHKDLISRSLITSAKAYIR